MKRHYLRNNLMAILLFLAVVGLPFKAFAEQKPDPTINLFNEKCSGCHTISGGMLVGPDLKSVCSWSNDDAAKAVKRMEKNVGPLAPEQVTALVKFLKDPNAAKKLKEAAAAKVEAPTATGEIAKGSPEVGEKLFAGSAPLKNGGMACIACHQVSGAGGTMGPDLTGVADKMGETGLASACEQTPFKVMKAAYKDHPVLKQEALDLTAYFVSLKQSHEKKSEAPVPVYGLAIALVVLAAIAVGYRNRNTSARDKLQRR